MTYFWLEESDLSAGSGYSLFGAVHLISLAVAAVFIVCALICFRRSSPAGRSRLLKLTALLLALTEVFKLSVLAAIGRMGIGHLPLHLCSFAIYVDLAIAFSRPGKLRSALGEISLFTLLPAALMALIFPDWTMYPWLNFMNLSSYFWHSLQILFPLMCLEDGIIRPSIRRFWLSVLFLTVTGLPVLLFNKLTGCNYFFLLRPVYGTPLEYLYARLGAAGYVFALFLLYCLVVLCFYGLYYIVRALAKRTGTRRENKRRKFS